MPPKNEVVLGDRAIVQMTGATIPGGPAAGNITQKVKEVILNDETHAYMCTFNECEHPYWVTYWACFGHMALHFPKAPHGEGKAAQRKARKEAKVPAPKKDQTTALLESMAATLITTITALTSLSETVDLMILEQYDNPWRTRAMEAERDLAALRKAVQRFTKLIDVGGEGSSPE
jgi:hypothetical protein